MALVSPEPLSAFVFEVVLGGSLAPLPLRGPAGDWIGFEQAPTAGRPVTGAAVAQSMRLRYPTVLRHAKALVEAGHLVRERGYTVAPDVFADGRAGEIAAANASDLMGVAMRLAEAGHPAAAALVSVGAPSVPPGVIERLLSSFRLRTLECVTDLYGDVVSSMIVPAIIAANVAEITADPALALRYAAEDSPPPDALRRPVTLRAVARELGLPAETVRRRAAGLLKSGTIVGCGGGVIVPARVLMTEAHLLNNRRIARNFEDVLTSLTKLNGGGPERVETR